MNTPETIKEFEPNRVLCGRMCLFKVELLLVEFQYSKVVTAEVRGNIRGLDVLQGAVDSYYESLCDQLVYDDDPVFVELDHPNDPEDKLECEIARIEDLTALVFSARVVSVEPLKAIVQSTEEEGD